MPRSLLRGRSFFLSSERIRQSWLKKGGSEMNTPKRQLSWLSVVCLALLSACGGGGDGDAAGSPGTIQLESTVFDAVEGTSINIRVARSAGSAGAASVDYAITDRTAVAGSDYEAANNALTGTITYPDQGFGNRTISVRIIDDNIAEGAESFAVTLSNVSGATLGANSSATVTILDNDSAALSAFGAITELNSVTVGGIRYDANAANVTMNGLPASVSDLKVGQVVALEGEANLSDGTGTASEIFYAATVIGPVEHIEAALNRLIVMGQTVLTHEDTAFDPSIDPDTFAGLALGAITQISGFFNDAGELLATRIDPDTTSADVRLIGVVSGLDLDNMLFSINRLTIDYGSASLIDLPGGIPSDGLLVFVHGSLTDGVLVVNQIGSVSNSSNAPGERVRLAGIVTRLTSATDFDLNGFPITTDANTGFVGGAVGDLQTNAAITIDGEVAAGGDTVLASLVTFGEPVIGRMTRAFDFEHFSHLSVFGLSSITVTQASDFSIEVTVAETFIDDVDVTQDGDTVTLGGDHTQLFSARVTVPALNQLDVDAEALAHVTLRNFDQAQLSVNVAGVSSLRGEGLRIGTLMATVSGVSWLDFGDIRPIGNAHIEISGVSQATLNMEVGSTLTGSVTTGQGTGESRLFYFGANVTETVATDSLSRVLRLGDTKP